MLRCNMSSLRLNPSPVLPIWRTMSTSSSSGTPQWHGTTILSVRKNGRVVVAGDGQVSMGQTVMKPNARKAMAIAGDLCVYTNHNVTLEALDSAA